MKKFYLKSLLFTGLVLFIVIFLDSEITKGLKRDNQSNMGVWNTIYAGKINSDILITGSSRAVFHINPLILSNSLNQKTYNIGLDGQMFEIQYCRFKIYLQHNPPPKTILQSIDCHTLSKTQEIYDYHQFLPFLKDSTLKSTLRNLKGISKYDYVLPMARYAGEFNLVARALQLRYGLTNPAPNRYNGFEGHERTWNNDLAAAKKLHPDKLKIILDKRVIRAFEEYIQYCKANNINLILVYTPEYIEGQSLIKNRRHIIAFYEKLSKKYNVPLLNYSNSKLSLNRSLFYNSLHLNSNGANIFSTTLAQDLKKLNYVH